MPRELADRRRLAGSIHAGDEDDRGLRRQVDPVIAGVRDPGEQLGQALGQGLTPRDPAVGGLLLELPHDFRRGRGAHVGVDQGLLEPLPGLVAQVLEQGRLDLGGERLAGLTQVLAKPAEHAAPPLLGLRRRFVIRARPPGPAVDDKKVSPVSCHRAARLAIPRPGIRPGPFYAASSWAGSLREITFEMPSAPIDTPYNESAASIVRFWWVTTMN